MFKYFFEKKPQLEYIDITRELLGVFIPRNAPSIAKAYASQIVQKHIRDLWDLKKSEACRFGVVITFPSDTKIDPSQFSPYIDERILSIAMDKMQKKRFFKKSIDDMYIVDWYYGNFFKGSFTKNGKTFDATSFSIQVCGISKEIYRDLIMFLLKESYSKKILVLDYIAYKVYFISNNKEIQ